MGLGNDGSTAAAKACGTFIFLSFFLSLLLSLLLSFLLSRALAAFLLCPASPVCAFLFIASLPTIEEGTRRRRRRRRWRKKRLTQRLLFASFVIPLIFLPAAANDYTAAAFFRRSLSSSNTSSFSTSSSSSSTSFSSFSFLARAAHIPSPDYNSAGLSAPRHGGLFLLRCSAPAYPNPPAPPEGPRPRAVRARSGFFLSVLQPRSFVFSFFLSSPFARSLARSHVAHGQ